MKKFNYEDQSNYLKEDFKDFFSFIGNFFKRLFWNPALWTVQKRIRGFSDRELWDLDNTIAEFILPRLKRFKNKHDLYPGDSAKEEWDKNIDLMIEAFEMILNEDDYIHNDDYVKSIKNYNDKIKKGLKIFSENFMNLWY